jgi:hypothetical protein
MATKFCVLSDGECGGSLDGVPILLCKGIGSLLETFLALGETLVLSDSHDCDSWGEGGVFNRRELQHEMSSVGSSRLVHVH